MKLDLNPTKPRIATWREEDYLMAVCAAQPLMATGMNLEDALAEVQLMFPPEKHRPPEGLRYACRAPLMRRILEQVDHLAPESRQEQAAKLAALAGRLAVNERPKGAQVKWSKLEWALIERRVRHMQRNLGDKRSVYTLVIEAQYIELPPSRWRKERSLQALTSGQPGDVALRLKEIKPYSEQLLLAEPFVPGKTRAEEAPEPEPTTPDTALAAALVKAQAEVPPPQPAQAAPEPEPEPVKPARQRRTRQELPSPFQATTPAPSPIHAPGGTLEALGQGIATLLGGLMEATALKAAHEALQAQRTEIRQIFEAVLGEATTELKQFTQATVKATLEAHLGGTVEVVAPAVETNLTGSGLPQKIKVDIVGLYGQGVVEIKKAMNGYADALRFIDVNATKAWTPRDVVIVNDRVSSRHVEQKCREAHASVIHVYGSTSAVLTALKAVYERQGVELELHQQ